MTCIDVTLPPLTKDRPLLLVAAALLINTEGLILLSKRPSTKAFAGYWEFPGGKVTPLETPEEALVRELKEELTIETSTGCFQALTFASYPYPDFHLLMPLFACRIWQGEPVPTEEQILTWVRKDELRSYEMPPADLAVIPLLWDLL